MATPIKELPLESPDPLGFLASIRQHLGEIEGHQKELHALVKALVGPERALDPVERRKQAEGGKWTPYTVRSFALDTARTDVAIPVEGDFIHAWTDGAYAGIGVRFNKLDNDVVYFQRRNPIYGFGFWQLFLTHTAQAGRTLDLLIGRDASVYAETNQWEQRVSVRGATTLHRNAITAVDKIAAPVAMTSGATAATGGSLAASTTYNMVASAYNRWGVTAVPAVLGQATGAGAPSTHVVKGTLAQVTGADGYDLFMGTPAAPLWVDRITEAERASANGVEITAVGTHQAGAALGAGVIQFNVVGTGVASTSANFAQNNAYTPAAAGITAIDCSGYEKMMVMVKLALTDLRSAPSLSIVPFVRNELSTDDWHADSIGILSLLGALGQPLVGELALDVRAAANVKLLIDTIAGQGAAASIWYALTR